MNLDIQDQIMKTGIQTIRLLQKFQTLCLQLVVSLSVIWKNCLVDRISRYSVVLLVLVIILGQISILTISTIQQLEIIRDWFILSEHLVVKHRIFRYHHLRFRRIHQKKNLTQWSMMFWQKLIRI